ncbi:MAG: hypothetical protein P9X24_11660 [Candidatus Hatepunaea meridiana]|nr:hypothetical protein [Candidatus Hatepunaea meridiana]
MRTINYSRGCQLRDIYYLFLLWILILCFVHSSLVQAEWGENVELVNYPIRQKIPIGVIEDGVLYGNNRMGLQIIDVSNPANMTEIAFLPLHYNEPSNSTTSNTRWIALNEGYCYIRADTPAGVDSFDVYIIDVRNPR